MINYIGSKINNKYTVQKLLGQSELTESYEAYDESGQRVVVKFLNSEMLSTRVEDVIRFKNDFYALSRIDDKKLLGTLEYGVYEGVQYIVSEYAKGEKILNFVNNGHDFTINDIVGIIQNVALILEKLHSKSMVYKDINSANIYLDLKSKDIILNGFSLYHLKEYNVIKKQDSLYHTFAYAPPEVIGLIKKPVDERSDLYSLGVLFYYILTHELPFESDNITSLIYEIMVKVPRPPSQLNENIPKIIDEIVLKLLQKELLNRYQSTMGLLKDLQLFLTGNYDFQPGDNDHDGKLKKTIAYIDNDNFRENVFGDIILKNSNILCVAGESGMGKTRFLEEIESKCLSSGILILGAKCHNDQNKNPYEVVRTLLKSYVKYFKLLPVERRTTLKKYFNSKLELSKYFLIRFLSDLSDLIEIDTGSLLNKNQSNDDESRNLISALISLITLIYEEEQKLILSVDDIQFADEKSVEFFEILIHNFNPQNFCIYCTANPTEIKPQTRFSDLFAGLKSNLYYLELFKEDTMKHYINNLLGDEIADQDELINYVSKKSRLNPLFAREILSQLISKYILVYRDRFWWYDAKNLLTVIMPESAIDIIIKKISNLSKDEYLFLSYVSVIGKPVNVSFLLKLDLFSEEHVVNLFDRCIKMQFLSDLDENGYTSFVHSRIQEYFYEALSDSKKKIYHNNIGFAYEADDIIDINENIFQIIHHFKQAGNRQKIGEYAFIAGIIAKESYAYEDARSYLILYKDYLLKEDVGKIQKQDLLFNLAEVDMYSGRYGEAAETFLELALIEDDIIKIAEIYKNIAKCYYKIGNFDEAKYFGNKGLIVLGDKTPNKKISVMLAIAAELTYHFFQVFYPVRLIMYRQKKKDSLTVLKYKKMMWIYEVLLWVYLLSDNTRFYHLLLRGLNLAERKIGISKELSLALRFYASMNMALGHFKKALEYFKKSRRVDQLLDNRRGIAQALQLTGFCYQWMGQYNYSADYFEQSIELFKKEGDYSENTMNYVGMYFDHYYRGNYEDALKYLRSYKENAEFSNDKYGLAASKIYEARIKIESGEMDSAEILCREGFKIANSNSIEVLKCTALTELGKLFLIERDYSKAKENLEEAKRIFESNNLIKSTTVYLYAYLAEAYIKEYREERVVKLFSKTEKSIILRKINDLCKISNSYSKKWVNYRSNHFRVSALYYDLIGKHRKSSKLFQKAIDAASKTGRKFELAKSYYDYGVILSLKSSHIAAGEVLENALRLFSNINSKIYIRRTMVLLDYKDEKSSMQRLLDKERLDSILIISQQISSILNPEELLEYVVQKAVEVVAAHRGYIYIKNESTGEIELRAKKSGTEYDAKTEPLTLAQECFKKRTVLLSGNAINSDDFSKDGFISKYDVKSFTAIPIKNHEKVIGACYIDNPLMHDVFTYEDVEILTTFLTQAAIALENAYLYNNLEKKVDERTFQLNHAYEELNSTYEALKKKDLEISKDLELARRVQTSILPDDTTKYPFLDFSFKYIPMSTIGGDIYDIVELKENYVRIFLADATGHGVQAALVTMILKTEYEKLKYNESPGVIFDKFNNILLENYSSIYLCFTGVIIDIDYSAGKMYFSSAGHPDQLLYIGNELLSINSPGKILGVVPDAKYKTIQFDVLPGDKIFIYTDGLFEQFNSFGEEFGEQHLKNEIQKLVNLDVDSIIANIINKLDSFANHTLNESSNDDITLIAIEIMNNYD